MDTSISVLYRPTADTKMACTSNFDALSSLYLCESLGNRDFRCLRTLAYHAQKAPCLQVPGTPGQWH